MKTIEFYFNDIDYITDDAGFPVVQLFGLTKSGEQVTCLDKNFRSYFYVDAENLEEFEEKIKNHEFNDSKVVKTEFEEKTVGSSSRKLIKVYTRHPKEINRVRKELEEFDGFIDSFEYDVRTVSKYIMSRNISPLCLIKAEGEMNEFFEAKNIENTGEYLEKPRYMVFDIEVYGTTASPDALKNEITMISYKLWDGRKGVLGIKAWENNEDWYEYVKSEKEMLEKFTNKIKSEEIDIISGYNSDGFDFPYLKERCKIHGIKLDIGFGGSRVKISKRGSFGKATIKGLVHADIYRFISRILGPNMRTETFKLDDVANELVGENKLDVKWYEMNDMWKAGSISKLAEYSLKDAVITAELFEHVYPIMLELCKITRLPLGKVSRGSYSAFVEGHLMNESFQTNRTINKKPGYGVFSRRHGRTYEGAFVFEPEPGVYDDIVFLDFRSLYPTIIVSHNISPETVECNCCDASFCEKKQGFIPNVLANLIGKRKIVKSELKNLGQDNENYQKLKSRDYSLKTVLNATYGYLGFENSRWYSMECASEITRLGRKYIKESMSAAEKEGFKVVYGDTDSLALIMKNKTREDVLAFLKKINSNLPGIMELELEKYYKRGIFVSKKSGSSGAKKKYALIDENGVVVVKGLEFVRRDWAEIAKKTQHKVLEIILKKKDSEAALETVSQAIKSLKEQKIPYEEVAIYTQIKKRIEDYSSKGPHVAAAIKALEKGYEIKPGMLIRYIVTKGIGSISNRSVIFKEVVQNKIPYDSEYYINNQVLPAVRTIFSSLNMNVEEALQENQKKLESFFG